MKELKKMIKDLAMNKADYIIKDVKENGIAISYNPDFNKEGLMSLLDIAKSKLSSYILVLIGKDGDRYTLVVGVSKDNVEKGIFAGNIVKKVTSLLGGNGGGRKDMAQGSVKSVDNLSSLTKDSLLN